MILLNHHLCFKLSETKDYPYRAVNNTYTLLIFSILEYHHTRIHILRLNILVNIKKNLPGHSFVY